MRRSTKYIAAFCVIAATSSIGLGQEQPPKPSEPKAVTVPAVQEKALSNGLKLAVVQRSASPLVTIHLMIRAGAGNDGKGKDGLANITADMLAKGTATRTATQIAEDIEFLGGSINTGANWNSTFVAVTVTSDKLDAAMAIFADVVLNPKFDAEELDLLKSQTLDGLSYNLKQPGFVANYVASKYTFGEHPAGGTPDSIGSITRKDVGQFYVNNFYPRNAVLIITGDADLARVEKSVEKVLGKWSNPKIEDSDTGAMNTDVGKNHKLFRRMLVIDLPNSGQAAVTYAKQVTKGGRRDNSYYPASVLNSVLGGGYSSRLNYEIRIKRGLSYGAGSSFAWRSVGSDFATRTQTKNESAAEVASLVLEELKRLTDSTVDSDELVPRKSVLTGGFGRSLETTNGLAGALSELYSFGIPTGELNAYDSGVNGVTGDQIKAFASANLLGGDIIIVGDYSVFKDDLAKRFPDVTVDVIKADDLDLSRDELRK